MSKKIKLFKYLIAKSQQQATNPIRFGLNDRAALRSKINDDEINSLLQNLQIDGLINISYKDAGNSMQSAYFLTITITEKGLNYHKNKWKGFLRVFVVPLIKTTFTVVFGFLLPDLLVFIIDLIKSLIFYLIH